MDLTEEKVSFDQMPTVVSELKQEISGLKTLIRTLIDATGAALAIPNESDPLDIELQSVDKNDAENVTPIVTPDVTPDKAALKIKNNHARRRKRFRFFCALEPNERKMLW